MTSKARYRTAAILAAAAIAGSTAGPASASTGPVHYYADDTGGGRFGPAVTGSAAEGIATLAARYERDPATFAQVAAFAGFRLPGGTAFLLAHRGQWQAEVTAFYAFMRATIREEVTWTSPYRTEFAVPHGTAPTTFGWTSMPDVIRSVLVFTWGALVMQCGGQPYIPAKRIPLPSRPKHCATGGFQPCVPCPSGTRLFTIPGIGRMCLCPLSVLVTVTTTVTTTTTTVVMTTTTYGVCPPKKKGKKAKPCSSGG
jgi:hypothetical protein